MYLSTQGTTGLFLSSGLFLAFVLVIFLDLCGHFRTFAEAPDVPVVHVLEVGHVGVDRHLIEVVVLLVYINIILTFCRLGRQPGWDQDPKVQPEQKWQWWAIEIVLKWIWLRAGKQKVKMVEIDTWCVLPSLSLSFMSHPAAKSRLTGGSHSRMHHYYQWHVYPAEKSMFNRQHHYCLLLSFGLLFRH